MANSRDTFIGILCGMAAGALWGLVFLAPELARDFSPLQLAAGRYLAYGLIAAALIAPRWRLLVPRLGRREWLALVWLSFACNTLYYVLLSNAIHKGGIAMTSLVIGFMPVAVTIIGSRDRGAVPLQRLLPSLLLSAGGAFCIGWQALAVPADGPFLQRAIGLLCAIGALIAWTVFIVGNSRWLARLRHVSAHDWNLLMGVVTGVQALALVPLSLVLDT
ncbi:MAG TPA: DMT family transporter, partial [Pedomonas sp.]|uniref:DMT family transporter n=1 Tax=Pedomonas sp. TaxID=2976421 RepID=UPI002F3F6FA7